MSTTPLNKPERSFSFNKLKGALRRPSKQFSASNETPAARHSFDSSASGTQPTGTASVPSTPKKTPSLRKASLDQGRPSRHGRSASVSVVPSTAADKAPDFDPFSESHDADKSKRTWSVRKTVKGALKRTTSRLSVSSATSASKPTTGSEVIKPAPTTEPISKPEPIEPIDPIAVTPPVYSSSPQASLSGDNEAGAPPATSSEPVSTPVQLEQPTTELELEQDHEDKPTAQKLELETSQTSLDWEHIDIDPTPIVAVSVDEIKVEKSSSKTPSVSDDEVVHEASTVETVVDAAVPAIVEPEARHTETKGLQPLDVGSLSRSYLSPLRSEIVELSPIIESPLTARDEKQPMSIQITSTVDDELDQSLVVVDTPQTPVAEPVVEQPIVTVASEPVSELPQPQVSESFTPSHPTYPPTTPRQIDTTLTPPQPQSREATSPTLNAIELGVPEEDLKEIKTVTNHFDLEGPSSVSRTEPTTNANVVETNSYGLIANTAWFLGACVVVGVGMIVGQVRSYRQVYRSTFQPVRRWFNFDWWKF